MENMNTLTESNDLLVLNQKQYKILYCYDNVYRECYNMKIPHQVEYDKDNSSYILSFPSKSCYDDFVTYIYDPYLKEDEVNQ